MTDEINSNAWYFDENIPGSGDRPEYLEPKYKSVAEQAKAYKEARKALGALSGAPDSYNLDPYAQHIQLDNPAIKNLTEYAKANRINQDAMDKFVNTLKEYEESQIPNLSEELAKLDGGAQRYDTVTQWAKNTMSQSDFEVFEAIPKTAETIGFFDSLRQKEATMRQTGSMSNNHTQEKPVTLNDLKSEMRANYKRYTEDSQYRANLENRMKLAAGN